MQKHKEELRKCQGKPHNLTYVNAQIKRDLVVSCLFWFHSLTEITSWILEIFHIPCQGEQGSGQIHLANCKYVYFPMQMKIMDATTTIFSLPFVKCKFSNIYFAIFML